MISNDFVIVVLNYNDYKTVYEFVEHVDRFNKNLPLVIVDNKSTDDSYQELKKLERSNISVIQTDKNRGYAYGNNFGVKFAEEKYPDAKFIGISNPDIILNEDCLAKIAGAFEKNPQYASLTGVMYYPDGHVDSRPYLTMPTYLEVLQGCFYLSRKIFAKRRDRQVDTTVDVQKVEALPGCFFIYERKAFDTIGGFDENTFLYYEENILAKRMQQHNLCCGIVTDAKYIHHHSKSIGKSYNEPKKFKIFYDSVKYYFKTYEGVRGVKYQILTLFLEMSLVEYKIINCINKILRR